jgi:hypothetical protein
MPPEEAAPVQATQAAPAAVEQPAAPPAPVDRDMELSQQIERAKAKVAEDEKKAARAGKQKGKAKANKATETVEPATEAAPEVESESASPEEESPAPEREGKSHQELLEAGDIEGAFLAAFGKPPAAFGINSKRWAEFREETTETKRKLRARSNELQAYETKLAHATQELTKDFAPMAQARDAFKEGRYEDALKLAFDVPVEVFQRGLLKQFHSKDPRIEKLQAELQAEREERKRFETEREQRAQQERQQQARIQWHNEVKSELAESDDPKIARMATKPRFIQRVMQIQEHYYDRASRVTIPAAKAAEMVRKEIEAEFGPILDLSDRADTPARPDRAGKSPARPINLSQRGATEASPPGRALTDDELFAKYTKKLGAAAAE